MTTNAPPANAAPMAPMEDPNEFDAICNANKHMEEMNVESGQDHEEEGEWKEQDRKVKRKQREIKIDAKVRHSETNETQESSTIQEKIRARGERGIDIKQVVETSIRAEWNLNAGTQKFSARSALVRLLRKMATVDKIEVVSPATGDKWALYGTAAVLVVRNEIILVAAA